MIGGQPRSGRRTYCGSWPISSTPLGTPTPPAGSSQRLKTLTHPALLVVDEIGYLSVTPNGARLFFQLVNARYGHASTVPTSNKGFEHWGEILHDEVMAGALLDRLHHRCHLVNRPTSPVPHRGAQTTWGGDAHCGPPAMRTAPEAQAAMRQRLAQG